MTKSFGERAIVRDLSMRIMRGDRLGLIGPNGAGKSTLIKLILGTLAPDGGTVRLGTNLLVAYFDQLREQLDPEKHGRRNHQPRLRLGRESASERKHVMSYLGDFLFAPQRANSPVKALSGGERNRLLLARLFARPANVLVMDEPTNDLDIDSLELLEAHAAGLLRHAAAGQPRPRVPRQRRDPDTWWRKATVRWQEYVGGYSDWLAQRPKTAAAPGKAKPDSKPARVTAPVKLSHKESRELTQLPLEIEAIEKKQQELTARMSSADYHKQGSDQIKADRKLAEDLERDMAVKFERWSALEAKAGAAGKS